MKKPEPTITELADAAFKKAALKVIERARQTGTPVITWVDGAVKAVDPDVALKMMQEPQEPDDE